MPLGNNAKIGDIITALEGMQAINQKAELASVIGAPANASDNVATQITKLQSAKNTLATKIGVTNTMPIQEMANTLVVGKKWASGTIVSSSTLRRFQYYGNSNVATRGAVEVTGLNFKPSLVMIRGIANNSNVYIAIYSVDDGAIRASGYSSLAADVQSDSFKINFESAYINETGFCLPGVDINRSHSWLAFE